MRRARASRPKAARVVRCRGSLFHYYLVYMLLTGILLTIAGASIHTILRADHRDAETSRQLHSLLKLQQALRHDLTEAETAVRDDIRLTLSFADGTTIVWTTDGNIVDRSITQNQQFAGRERFVFTAGTETAFEVDPQVSLLALRLTDPPYAKAAQEPPAGPTELRRSVEILCRLPHDGSPE